MQQDAIQAKRHKQQQLIKKRMAKVWSKQSKTLIVSPGMRHLTLSQQKRTAYFAGDGRPEKRAHIMSSSHTIKSRGYSPNEDKENVTPAHRLHNNQQEN